MTVVVCVIAAYVVLGLLYAHWFLGQLAAVNSFYATVVGRVKRNPGLLLLMFLLIGSVWPFCLAIDVLAFVRHRWQLWRVKRHGHHVAVEWDDRRRRLRALSIVTEEFILEHGNREMTPEELAVAHIRLAEILGKLEAGEHVEWPSSTKDGETET